MFIKSNQIHYCDPIPDSYLEKVGFSDFALFNRVFKRITGLTASAYRNLALKGGSAASPNPPPADLPVAD